MKELEKKLLLLLGIASVLSADVYVKMTDKEFKAYMHKITKDQGLITSVYAENAPQGAIVHYEVKGKEVVKTFEIYPYIDPRALNENGSMRTHR